MSAWRYNYLNSVRRTILVEHISPMWCTTSPIQLVPTPLFNSFNHQPLHHHSSEVTCRFQPGTAADMCVTGCYRKNSFWERQEKPVGKYNKGVWQVKAEFINKTEESENRRISLSEPNPSFWPHKPTALTPAFFLSTPVFPCPFFSLYIPVPELLMISDLMSPCTSLWCFSLSYFDPYNFMLCRSCWLCAFIGWRYCWWMLWWC